MTDYSTKEAVLSLGNIDPELEELLQVSPIPDIDFSPDQLKNYMADVAQKKYDACPTHGTTESVLYITMRDGYQSEIRVTKPPSTPENGSPLVTLIYGGGFMGGSCLQDIPLARTLAALYEATVVTLSYRLAPEHKFPTASNDIWDSIQWLAKNASSLGDPSQGWVIGGPSAGGNLTAVVVSRALKEDLSPRFTGLLACIPLVLSEETVPKKYKELWVSREQNSTAPSFNGKHMAETYAMYQPDFESEEYSPFNSETSFSSFPPTYVQVCGMDPLRDDGLIYEKVLRDNGVKTRLDAYPGMVHGHWVTFPGLKQSVKARIDMIEGYGWLLGKEVGREKIVPFERYAG